MKKKVIHLIDDESIIHDIFNRILSNNEYEILISENKSQAISNHSEKVDVTVIDLMIPGTSGLEIFKELKNIDKSINAIFLTAFGTIETAIEAIKMGAIDYMQKPFNNIEIKHKIDRIIKEKEIKNENLHLKKVLNKRFSFENIIGKSPILQKTLSVIESVADSSSTVLITGESGTGKEMIAKALFQNSNRRNKPFFTFNSSNIPDTLFESILFGYKKGTFTGAVSDKKGIFEEARNGTIFFDEIANLNPETQKKILRVIQEKEFQPLGETKIVKVDVRIIAATNVNLREKVKTGEFREDLFYRLDIINIHLPPLRARKEDISLLFEHFLNKYNKENEKKVKFPDPKFIKSLMDYDWPGNIRELENTAQRAVLLSTGDKISTNILPSEILNVRKYERKGNFNELVDNFKKQIILESLDRNNWVQKKASEELQLKATTLSELMKRLEIKK
ncbi:MAG: sigma-54 dependent transcriptional regulator [Acidobacteriota bacterium]